VNVHDREEQETNQEDGKKQTTTGGKDKKYEIKQRFSYNE